MSTCELCSEGKCSKCHSGFELDGIKCLKCSQGEYFNPIKKVCIRCIENCVECINDQSCLYCKQDHLFVPLLIKCIQFSNCIFGMSLQGTCNVCPENCFYCKSEHKCEICKTGFILQHGQCIRCVENCLICLSNQACIECLPGFYLNNSKGRCTPTRKGTLSESEKFRKSYFFNPDTFKTEFSLENIFKRRAPNCVSFNINGICMACRFRYFLDADKNCSPCQQMCLVCIDSHKCLRCISKSLSIGLPNGFVDCLENEVNLLCF